MTASARTYTTQWDTIGPISKSEVDCGCSKGKDPGDVRQCATTSDPAHDQIRTAVAKHHRRRVRVPGVDVRHRRHVADPQPLDAPDPHPRVQNRHRVAVGPHPRRAGWMVVRLHETLAMRAERLLRGVTVSRDRDG